MDPLRWAAPLRRSKLFPAIRPVLLAALLPFSFLGSAQVMAHPGWAGSGVAVEPWWKRAVFYEIDPLRFQASGTGRTGDLAGVITRLDYLQALGVDALVLDSPPPNTPDSDPDQTAAVPAATNDTNSLETLIREASRHHLRVLLTVSPALAQGPRATLLATVHGWLNAGAAGVALPRTPPGQASATAGGGDLPSVLGQLLRASSGDRVLLAAPSGTIAAVSDASSPRPRRSIYPTPARRTGQARRIVPVADLPTTPATGAGLRAALLAATNESAGRGEPLLRFAADPETASPNAVAEAAALLLSRGAALIHFGDEIGLQTDPPAESAGSSSTDASPNPADAPSSSAFQPTGPVMQWTPANVQRAPIERAETAATFTQPGEATPLGAYHAFVRPPPSSLTGAAPAGPTVAVDHNLAAPLADPDTLPGFTAGTLPADPVDGATVNAATEERDPTSVLSAYRQLLALHHGNAALHGGEQIVLDHDFDDALVFLRRPSAAARTGSTVIVAANLGDTPIVLSLDAELLHLGLRTGSLRTLFSYGPHPLTAESTGSLRLPAHAVFLGELAHSR